MERVSEVLQFPVIIERSRAFSVEPQSLQKLNFLLGGGPAERTIIKEFFEPGRYLRLVRPLFNKLKPLRIS